MIEMSNEMFTLLVNTLNDYDANIKTDSVYTNKPSEYPFVSLEEIDNRVYEQGSDCCETENFAEIDYEINIYTKGDSKKSKADDIAQTVDTLFNQYGFVRQFRNPIQSGDETIYRIVMRYRGVVSKDHTIYRR